MSLSCNSSIESTRRAKWRLVGLWFRHAIQNPIFPGLPTAFQNSILTLKQNQIRIGFGNPITFNFVGVYIYTRHSFARTISCSQAVDRSIEDLLLLNLNQMATLSDGELWVSFEFEPEDPEEEWFIEVPMKVHRSQLSSHESAKAIIPWLLSHTTLPEQFHHCPEFIKYVSEYVCSLPSHVRHLYVYGFVIVAWDETDPSESVWTYRLSTVKQVKIEEANSECAICLLDLLVGAEAAKLPCSHVYHGGCIVQWLDSSNQCPLCRSQVV
jgi:hypothetical protein